MHRKMNWLTSAGSRDGLRSGYAQFGANTLDWHLLPCDEEFTARGSGRQDED